MNNSQFRNLLVDKPAAQQQNESSSASTPKPSGSSLGAKRSSFMPMTPRNVQGGSNVDFARQVRERNVALQPAKKQKTSVPKGIKYATGYIDRAKARADAEGAEGEGGNGGDDRGERIQALEEQMKLGQIAPETFIALRDRIAGGEVGSTHLVKGLDWRLLERVKRGEDVMGTGKDKGAAAGEEEPDVDDELDELAEKEVTARTREKVEKKGSMGPPKAVAGVKRSRDEIMKELKAQRKAEAEAKAAPALGDKWKKVGEQRKGRVELDHKGREVMITVDEDGVVKKKVRRVPVKNEEVAAEMPDTSKPVLGADATIPEAETAHAKEDDSDGRDDIFEGVGVEYNPLGNDDDDDDDGDSEDDSDRENEEAQAEPKPTSKQPLELDDKSPSHDEADTASERAAEKPAAAPRNYFNDAPSAMMTAESSEDRLAGMQNLLKKAAKTDPKRSDEPEHRDGETKEAHEARLKKRAQMLANEDRDMEDMDIGFGSSRYDDGEEGGEGKKVRLSEWKGGTGGDEEELPEGEKGGEKRKRKPKKRKGDAKSAADVMRVVEGRKAKEGN